MRRDAVLYIVSLNLISFINEVVDGGIMCVVVVAIIMVIIIYLSPSLSFRSTRADINARSSLPWHSSEKLLATTGDS